LKLIEPDRPSDVFRIATCHIVMTDDDYDEDDEERKERGKRGEECG